MGLRKPSCARVPDRPVELTRPEARGRAGPGSGSEGQSPGPESGVRHRRVRSGSGQPRSGLGVGIQDWRAGPGSRVGGQGLG